MSEPVLEFRRVRKEYALRTSPAARLLGRARTTVAVDDVDLALLDGEILGLVGESGSGKTTLAQMAVRLAAPTSGAVVFRGRDLATLSGDALRAYRANVQMVFQDSQSSLNPRKRIATAMAEPLRLGGVARDRVTDETARLLELVGLGTGVLQRFPHELSGGQRQRIGIARALALRPRVLVADEPVSSLDVSLQAQIVNLLLRLREDLKLTILFISHDLALVNVLADRVAVMELGRLVECGRTEDVLHAPTHAYTRRLLDAVPRGLERRRQAQSR